MQTSKEIHLISVRERKKRGGWDGVVVMCACQWAGEDCFVALLAHLGPQMMSFPIKIIGLDRKHKEL